jgi:outer membrane receptor protein involved in Fe transport
LTEARITNADLRWEWYPRRGELISVSGFFKRFTDPFVEAVSIISLGCNLVPINAESATNFGGELEIRKGLDVIGLDGFGLGLNLTLVDGSIVPRASNQIGEEELPLADQSNVLLNTSLNYATDDGAFNGALLFNYFGDRVRRYGQSVDTGDGVFERPPDVRELGRATLDGKFSYRLSDALRASLSARNLTNQRIEWVQPADEVGDVPVLIQDLGTSLSLSFTWSPR